MTNFITRYFQRRRERKRLIAEAEAELQALKCERMARAFMKGVEMIAVLSESGWPAVVAESHNKSDDEKAAELRLRYLKGEIPK